MDIPLTKEYFDEQFEFLARTVKEGFDATVTTAIFEDRLGKVEDRLGKVEDRLGKVEDRLGKVENRLTTIGATMVTKSYLDEKLFGLKGDLIVKMRKLEGAMLFVASVLKERRVLSDDDVQRLRAEYQIFPTVT